jgi:hypothetical protein
MPSISPVVIIDSNMMIVASDIRAITAGRNARPRQPRAGFVIT